MRPSRIAARTLCALGVTWIGCLLLGEGPAVAETLPKPTYVLTAEQTHNRFSRKIPPVLRVPSGAVIQVETEEATDGQLTQSSTAEEIGKLDFGPIHPLTGPIYVEGARPGDVLAVTLREIRLGSWGWTAIVPGFGFLSDEFNESYLKTFAFEGGAKTAELGNGISIPLQPFPGVMGVAPDTDEMLSTIPPRANGGNMDNPCFVEGTTVYFPIFVDGALFSIGDTHAVQGMGEVTGTAIEAPMTILFEVEVIKEKSYISEPHYETREDYAVTAYAETLDEAAAKVTRYMIDDLVHERGLSRTEAYVLCSLAGNLHVAEVVDVPHVLMSMHMPKRIFAE